MRTLLHMSDLHFGRVDVDVLAGLEASIAALAPDVIAVSGDLTQRAKRREFAAARAFLDRVSTPKVVVPGNHDVPLYNVAARLMDPLRRYRRFVGDPDESVFDDDEIVVVGMNTARSLVFKGGRINLVQVRRAREVFGSAPGRVRVLVTHHPFHLASAGPRDLVGRAATALEALGDCMPDILLAGHMHVQETGTTGNRYDLAGRSALVVQAGTATSTRSRGQSNSFNLLTIARDAVAVMRYDWSTDQRHFLPAVPEHYRRRGQGWVSDAGGEGALRDPVGD